MKNLSGLVIGGVIALIVVSLSVFTVDQRQNALVFQLGEIVSVKTSPGLYFKIPLIQNVRFYNTTIHTVDAREPERFITSEKKPVLVDSFVKWRIVDVKQFYVSVAGDISRAELRLAQTINDNLRAEFGKRTVHEVVSGEREKIMEILREKANEDAKKIGVQVLDVRLKRVDLTAEVSESVYKRMEAERKRVANELRSTGAGDAEKIRADADRQREVILAEAYRDAQRVKGEGDAKSSAIYSAAFGQNPEFYSFYRSLETYRATLKNKSDVLLLDPNSEFFRYFKNPGKGGR
ncbi:MAG TPA: protease modulator HflC [Burkholderiales bacterium]|jgi:membrane protease subunit HflC|nr:protease modulator HflC [Burkholderiales bacterium]